MEQPSTPTFRPLYQQIKEALLKRLAAGEWAPGTFLPSETALAQEYGVSQGTLRKALDELTAEKIVVRYQGKGTAVAMHDADRSLFQFFHLVSNSGEHQLPASRVLAAGEGKATDEEAEALGLAPGTPVIRIERVRVLDGRPVMNERLTLPAARFAGLLVIAPEQLPNTLYNLYQRRFGITVSRAIEKLAAIAADAVDAARLELAPGTPLLEIRRVALDLEQRPVELRVSHCHTVQHHYLNELG